MTRTRKMTTAVAFIILTAMGILLVTNWSCITCYRCPECPSGIEDCNTSGCTSSMDLSGQFLVHYPISDEMPKDPKRDMVALIKDYLDTLPGPMDPKVMSKIDDELKVLEICPYNPRLVLMYLDTAIFDMETVTAATMSQASPEVPDMTLNLVCDNGTITPKSFTDTFNEFEVPRARKGTNSKTKRVAIIDSGVSGSNSIESWLELGVNIVNPSQSYADDYGHGTAVAVSFITMLNKLGSDLDDTNVKIIPVKVTQECGMSTGFHIACGIYYAKQQNADVINISMGAYQESESINRAIFETSENSDLVYVTSAGNNDLVINDSTIFHSPSSLSRPYLGEDSTLMYNSVSDHVIEAGASNTDILMENGYDQFSKVLLRGSNQGDSMLIAPGYFTLPFVDCNIYGTSLSAGCVSAGVVHTMFEQNSSASIKEAIYSNSQISEIQGNAGYKFYEYFKFQ